MLGKLLALIAQTKGATVAAVLVAGAATATVAATTPEVQDAVQQLTANVGLSSSHRGCGDEDGQGQPVVVAQRNAAEKLLRDAYNKDHKALEDLRGGKDVDNKAVGEIVRKYDDQLRDTLNTALNDVAALTLGREGQVRKAEASASGSASPKASPSTSPSASGTATPKPSCSPKPSASGSATPKPSESAKPSGSGKPEDQGRVAVANRTTLDPAIQAIVDKAIKDMDALVTKATDEASKVPPPDRGKPSDNPGNKPEDKGGKPSDSPGGKPSDNPGNKPSASPKKP
jgi:hypothetical protein